MATALLSWAADILCGLWRWVGILAPYTRYRITPHHQYCLPVLAHMEPLNSSLFQHATRSWCPCSIAAPQEQQGTRVPLSSLRIGQGGNPPQRLSYIAQHHKTFDRRRRAATDRLQLSWGKLRRKPATRQFD